MFSCRICFENSSEVAVRYVDLNKWDGKSIPAVYVEDLEEINICLRCISMMLEVATQAQIEGLNSQCIKTRKNTIEKGYLIYLTDKHAFPKGPIYEIIHDGKVISGIVSNLRSVEEQDNHFRESLRFCTSD